MKMTAIDKIIKELKELKEKGGYISSFEMTRELRNLKPGEDGYHPAFTRKKATGNFSIKIHAYNPTK